MKKELELVSTEVVDTKKADLSNRAGMLDQADAHADKYRGISQQPLSLDQASILMELLNPDDVEIRPDGLIYLPEIKYRRRLNAALGPGGWALMPTSPFMLRDNTIMRQYALYIGGRFISEAVGEQEYKIGNLDITYATAAEGCKSNALMRCCKDLGIASELWDPKFISKWIAVYAIKVFNPKKGRYEWRRKDREPFPWEINLPEQTDKPVKSEAAETMPVESDPFVSDSSESASQSDLSAEAEPVPQPEGQKISDAQRRRLFAIAHKVGLSNDRIKDELKAMGYDNSKDILKRDYDDIILHFESIGAPF